MQQSIFLLVMACALYQPCACFYLTLLCVPLVMEKDPGSFVFWRKIFICLLVFAGAVLLYYLPWRLVAAMGSDPVLRKI